MRLSSLSSSLFALSFVVVIAGCDDVPFGPPAGEAQGPDTPIPESPTACDIAAHLTEVHCTGCHGGSTEPLLTLDGLKATVGAASIRYAGTLVVAGDAEGSLLFRKVHGPAANEGAQMPIGQVLDVELQEALRRWIDDGAVTDCTAIDPVEGGGGGIAPGGDIDVGAPPSDFATQPPPFAAGQSCSTNQWWQHAGDEEESFSMHPGRACIDCHSSSGDDDAPRFAFAGTVMGDLRDEDDCRGVPGVTVDILDASDAVVGSAVTNVAGNFGLCGPDGPGDNDDISCASVPLTSPWRVRLSYDGRTREMLGHQDAVGDCMSCHTATGRNGAPGRVVAP